jgi:hypothetical protein
MRKTENTSTITCDLCGYTVRDSAIEWSGIYEAKINGIKVDLCSECETNMHFDIPFLSRILGIKLVFESENLERRMKLQGIK